jgi:hypothetical protein
VIEFEAGLSGQRDLKQDAILFPNAYDVADTDWVNGRISIFLNGVVSGGDIILGESHKIGQNKKEGSPPTHTISLVHPTTHHEVLPESADFKCSLGLRIFRFPVIVMAREVLMHSFVNATMKGEVVFIALETSRRAENAGGARHLVDACVNG